MALVVQVVPVVVREDQADLAADREDLVGFPAVPVVPVVRAGQEDPGVEEAVAGVPQAV